MPLTQPPAAGKATAVQPSPLKLTAQQRAIVAHDYGPALVFAVAGAGKTTAIEQRIARLVKARVFAADRILATTFNTKNAAELKNRLRKWHGCEAVAVLTLNALGHAIITEAFKRGLMPYLQKYAFEKVDSATEEIFSKTKASAYERKVPFSDELETLDRDDFLTYVGKCKGNLCYADLANTEFSPALHKLATQAEAPKDFPWYLALYKLYEQTRRQLGLFTFDDQFMLGWELLASQASLRAHFQQCYACVLVDEFQDVNKAQAMMLDLLVAPHQNYMAVGDDDQTIYEWRGADPEHILGFAQRYQAKEYFMTENFRCMASQVVLANQVIKHNQERKTKQIQLTQGFAGGTYIQAHDSAEQMGAAIVGRIQQLQKQAVALKKMVVLVRIYAQTPPVEQQLIAHKIAYEIVGNVPFYMRPEVKVLIAYCRLAYFEQFRAEGNTFSSAYQEQWRECWNLIYWQPKRYIKREIAKNVTDRCLQGSVALAETLTLYATQVSSSVAEKINKLAADLTWLMQAFSTGTPVNRPPDKILQELEKRIGYTDYLSKSSGFAETGADRAATIEAFIRYAKNQSKNQPENQATLLNFLTSVKKLSDQHDQQATNQPADKLLITSIFRAKGLEWPYVFIPNCNDDLLPYKLNKSSEEERRLLYVAITRTQLVLYMDLLKDEPISPFLTEAGHEKTLKFVQQIAEATQKSPSQWSDADIWAVAVHTPRFGLDRYFAGWWAVSAEQQEAAAQLIIGCYQAIQARGLTEKLKLRQEHRQYWLQLLPKGVTPKLLSHPGIERRLDMIEKRISEKVAKRLSPAKVDSKQPIRNDWKRGDRVQHPLYDIGKIINIDGVTGEISVRFGSSLQSKIVKGGDLRPA